MSLQLIQKYYHDLEAKIRYGGSRKETAIRTTFQQLLEAYARQKNLVLVPELDFRTPQGKTVFPDGTLKDALRESWGYWESKDEQDDLDEEIRKKLGRGYPSNNILFEDSQTAVLIQRGQEVARVSMRQEQALHGVLMNFINFQPPEVLEFHQAIEQFKQDLPDLVATLRQEINEQGQRNAQFMRARADFLALCQQAINPSMVMDDVREMIIQHILTEDIFMTVFEESHYHRENNMARQLSDIVTTFFKGTIQRNILAKINPYYKIIKAKASQIANHHEKQRFLKILYENFYKAYNPKAADRLGIVYTPQEIVHFMIEAADYLTLHHFGRLLADEGVQILDPATGTGTFITELIEYLPAHRLADKYRDEIHCNEVAILPYYIANLNIEYTYAQKMGEYAEFKNICFVDTLDNLGFSFAGKQQAMNLGLTPENIERIKRQNEQKISVIIGNPPYNANQLNENDNNKNREYRGVDERIKETYIKHSTAQKTKLYDMYTRFIRWAADRLGSSGVVALVTNRSFLDARTYDGFRKVVAQEFDFIYIVDLGGDVRKNPKLSGTKNNVFGIQTGVAISFLVKLADPKGSKAEPFGSKLAPIFYVRRPEMETAKEKLDFLAATSFKELPFQHIIPDKQHNWLNLATESWDDFLPVASKQSKGAKSSAEIDAIFELYSLGVVTNRDDWVYDSSLASLTAKVNFLIQIYNQEVMRELGQVTYESVQNQIDHSIKWTRVVKNDLLKRKKYQFQPELIRESLYRPFIKRLLYFSKELNEMQYQNPLIFPTKNSDNIIIAVNVSDRPFNVLASKYPVDLHFNGDAQCLPLYRYDSEGNRHDNITDFALARFQSHYPHPNPPPTSGEGVGQVPPDVGGDLGQGVGQVPPDVGGDLGQGVGQVPPDVGGDLGQGVGQVPPDVGGDLGGVVITKLDIFHYVYAVLHDPAYRAKYELNLKRELPRIPFYDDFWRWAAWGQRLMALHVGFEEVEAWELEVRGQGAGIRSQEVGGRGQGVGIRGQEVGGSLNPNSQFLTPNSQFLNPNSQSLTPNSQALTPNSQALNPNSQSLNPNSQSLNPTPKLKADKVAGVIEIDSETRLHGVPAVAWEYKLGNRSALEWVLERYKEKTPSDPTIAEKFNTYRLADYKEELIMLLRRVCTVSVETMHIVNQL